MRRSYLICVLALCLCGCGLMLSPGPAPMRLQLRPTLPGRVAAKPVDVQLVVARPTAGNEISSDAIAVSFPNREIRYLSATFWTADVPFLVQRFMLEALEASGGLRGVGDDTMGLSADLRLLIDIREFGLRCLTDEIPSQGVFAAHVRLLDLRSGKILGSLNVEEKTQVGDEGNTALALACENALSRGLARCVVWVLQNSGKRW